jgi:hypothetical protein
MRVRCYKTVVTSGPKMGDEIESASGLTVGGDYLVIAMSMDANPPGGRLAAWLQILDDNDEPQWVPTVMFETLSSTLPTNWVGLIHESGNVSVAPAPWLERGFWERFYGDGTPQQILEARDTYRRERNLIREESFND